MFNHHILNWPVSHQILKLGSKQEPGSTGLNAKVLMQNQSLSRLNIDHRSAVIATKILLECYVRVVSTQDCVQ